MRFLVDECTGPAVVRWLRRQGHEVFSVYEEARGMEDEDIIHLCDVKGHGHKAYCTLCHS
jgi:hypothetical protein